MAMASSSGSMLSTNWISDPLFSHLSDLIIPPPPPPPYQPPTSPLTGTAGRRLIVNAKRKRRKSRAIKSSLTTYISTDAANFRHMVQHVTGVDEGLGNIFPDNHPFDPPLITSTSTPAANCIQQHGRSSCGGTSSTSVTVLPTLDTSAFLLQQEGLLQQIQGGRHQPVVVDDDVDDRQKLELVAPPTGRVMRERAFQMDPLINCFPTLDSWTVV